MVFVNFRIDIHHGTTSKPLQPPLRNRICLACNTQQDSGRTAPHQTLSESVTFRQNLSHSVRSCQMAPVFVRFRYISSDSVRFRQMPSDSVGFRQMLSDSGSLRQMPSESSGFCQIRSECVRLCRRTIRCKGRWNIRNVRPICFMHLRITHSFCCYVFRCFSCNLTADLLHSSFFLLPHLHHSAQHKPNDPIITLGYYCCGVTWSSVTLQSADPIHATYKDRA